MPACPDIFVHPCQVSLGDDLPSSLTDWVVLCHITNHVSPRAVSSIHVPSPAVVSYKVIIRDDSRNITNISNNFIKTPNVLRDPSFSFFYCSRNCPLPSAGGMLTTFWRL